MEIHICMASNEHRDHRSHPETAYTRITRRHARHNQCSSPPLMDLLSVLQHNNVEEAVKEMLQTLLDNGLQEDQQKSFRTLVHEETGAFRVDFSQDWPTYRLPLLIKLYSQFASFKCRLKRCSAKQKQVLRDIVTKLDVARIVYLKFAGKWTSAPLIVPGPE